MASRASRILAIDDVGRTHRCDALLDQNFPNPIHAFYQDRLAAHCVLLLGPRFALVRPEFLGQRAASLARDRSQLRRVFVCMGGTDPDNETVKALRGLASAGRKDLGVDVVIGSGNPHAAAVELECSSLPHAQLHVQTRRMAELMAAADLAIAAGGSATWERCVLGLPALVTVIADNQSAVAAAMAAAGAQELLGRCGEVAAEDYARALGAIDAAALGRMSRIAAAVCDGRGAERVAAVLSGHAGLPAAAAGTFLSGAHA